MRRLSPRRAALLLAALLAGCVVGASAAASDAAASAPAPADLVLTNARIYTVDATRSMAGALAVRAGKIVYVGNARGARAYVGPGTQQRNAAGRLVLPGLYDSHLHPTSIVDLDVCNLQSAQKSMAEMTAFVRACIDHYHVPAGEWLRVRQWNFSSGNEPDATHPSLRVALDLASTTHPIELRGNDGHHGAYNSLALSMATNASGQRVGYSRATLQRDFRSWRVLIGVDPAGEPNGTVNEQARKVMGTSTLFGDDLRELMKAPERITAKLNSVGITGMLNASTAIDSLPLYDALDHSGKLSVRTTLALLLDPDEIRTADGQPDWDRMVSTAKAIRERYSNNPLLRVDRVKLFADGILEGDPQAIPPTLPEVASLKPYLQPIFARDAAGKLKVQGYVDTAAPWCIEARARPDQYADPAATGAFQREHGYHPGQCQISSGQLQHERAVIMEFVRRFHLADFAVHIHAIGDVAVRTALDAIEAARAADGISTQHDALAHVQLAHPDDVARIGRDHLYVAYTYAWMNTDPEYDLSVIPFIDRVSDAGANALHPPDGYYERNAYPVRTTKAAGAVLLAGSDAPVETSDPRPFINMERAVTRSLHGLPPLNAAQRIGIRDVIEAYTINGARYLQRDAEAGSIEVGKSADFIVLDQDIVALADQGKPEQIGATRVLETWFMGKRVYQAAARCGPPARPGCATSKLAASWE